VASCRASDCPENCKGPGVVFSQTIWPFVTLSLSVTSGATATVCPNDAVSGILSHNLYYFSVVRRCVDWPHTVQLEISFCASLAASIHQYSVRRLSLAAIHRVDWPHTVQLEISFCASLAASIHQYSVRRLSMAAIYL
jgi:hypothetical protein